LAGSWCPAKLKGPFVGSLPAQLRDRLRLGETDLSRLLSFGFLSVLAAILVTALVRVIQMFTVTNSQLWLGIIGVVPGAVLAAGCLAVALWAFGSAKRVGARAYNVGVLVSVLAPVLAIEAAAGIVTLLWQHGAIVPAHGGVAGLWASERYFLWHTLDAIPFLEIADTFGWGEPTDLVGGAPGWIVVGLKVVVLIPVARLLVSVYWAMRDHESILQDDPDPDDYKFAGAYALFILPFTGLAYAFLILLWSPGSVLARLLDRLPDSVQVADLHVGLLWLTPTIRWLSLGLLLFYCAFLGVGAVLLAVMMAGSIRTRLLTVLAVLLWLHLALVLTAATTILFVRSGLATTTPSLPADAPITIGVGDQVWNFVNAVPGLDIPKTTHWNRHYAFAGWPVGVLTLGLRLSAVAAMLGVLWLLSRVARPDRNGVAAPIE
jgi:hypothetical protein